ncbi:hypothetical protein [Rhodococcus sp. ACPA1]|uniref:hypothetical protein n=1 Tax=Rhodococcus sp. ACPA1 TaxID=2028572 RepID=UPI00117BACB5|nr:hypothetical protein [Rhodococcus sp. ACPA1]
MVLAGVVDWGNIPAWIGSILTGGSLLLGFYILLRDRWKEEKEQAKQLLIRRIRKSKKREGYDYLLVITNTSELPFYDVSGTLFFTGPNWSWIPRHLPIGSVEHRRIAAVRKAIDRGGRDDWPLEWSDQHHGDDLRSNTLSPGETVTSKVWVSEPNIFMVIRAKDSRGRFWGYEAKSRVMFRYEKHDPYSDF